MTAHKHAEVIKQWADGAEIEYREPPTGAWVIATSPTWERRFEYRVKPAREYPQTRMTDAELTNAYDPDAQIGFESMVKCRKMVNAALRHAIDNGQVVTREEFDRVTHELKRAQDTLRSAGYTDHGFQIWPPPIGNGYAECQADCSKTVAATVEAVSAFIERVNYPAHWNCTPKGIANAVRKAHELGKIMSVQEIDQ